MNTHRILILLCMLFVSSLLFAQDETRLLRFPTTNGQQIVFTYAFDLYTVPVTGGTARKLTSFEGDEMCPRFSPDGKQLAFTGQHDGNTEVFLMPAEGGCRSGLPIPPLSVAMTCPTAWAPTTW